jgi:hypothetical protein
MTSKNVRRVVSTRRLTTDEAAEARRLRDAVEKDKAEIVAEGHRMLAERRRHQSAVEGASTLGQSCVGTPQLCVIYGIPELGL